MPFRVTCKGSLQGNTVRGKTLVLAPAGKSLDPAVLPIKAKLSHPTTGALTGQGSSVSGTAFRVHPTTGALVGSGATVTGSALHFSPYPAPAYVLAGVVYGPGGMYTGTLTLTAGESIIGLRSFTGRF